MDRPRRPVDAPLARRDRYVRALRGDKVSAKIDRLREVAARSYPNQQWYRASDLVDILRKRERDFIAEADPATITALLDVYEAARAMRFLPWGLAGHERTSVNICCDCASEVSA